MNSYDPLTNFLSPNYLRKPAIVYPTELNYFDLITLIDKFSRILATTCPTAHDAPVCLLLGNTIEFLLAFYSCIKIGVPAAPLNIKYTQTELEYYISDLKPCLIVIPYQDEGIKRVINAIAKSYNISILGIKVSNAIEIDYWASTKSRIIVNGEQTNLYKNYFENVVLILHTSGSTGKPKSVPIKYRNLLHSVRSICHFYSLSPIDATVVVMPLFHVHGLIGVAMTTLTSGGSLVLPGGFSATKFLDLFKTYKCTWFSAVPTIHSILMTLPEYQGILHGQTKRNFGCLRFVRSCSSPLSKSLYEQMIKVYDVPVLQAYAMTEASHQMCSNTLINTRVGSVGLSTSVDFRILTNNQLHNEPHVQGEICISGPSVIDGYLMNEKANRELFINGFFRTGDVGYLDQDKYIYLTGRLKEIINRGGEKIAPQEIDDVLNKHPSVKEAICFGIPHEIYGQVVKAVVVMKNNVQFNQKLIDEHCKKHLASFKCPHVYEVVQSLPRTSTGKIQRLKVASIYGDKVVSKI
ncbi:o-succinylbenzoate-CoA ligase [Rozella allomycis CSF55]|uniref:AMP-binding domain-containing protein n=1 Tax=Rozella allomycis (strain CSF55) TaxID=988480 RepID=A0A075AQG5_ROZAC|nr:AMP-binding domain-containing protein [Rozella allomycis CSF55]RKP20151.1 o-succinylbenzoate-CoA ligase [Rozella allomycis CSF55]|eukprot:EPZ32491.1 AMP-binding domain-containing protein [Rozella allomycis CSF55]